MKHFSIKLLGLIIVLVMSSSNMFAQFSWTKHSGNPLNLHGASGSWDQSLFVPCVIFNGDLNRYEMWFTAWASNPNEGIGFAYSNDGITWTKNPNPVLTPGPTGWDSLNVGTACVIREGGSYKMWYTGFKSATRYPHSIGYATSPDGINWTKHLVPVLEPGTQAWEIAAVGCPSVIKVAGGYWMFYTGEVSNGIALTGRAFSTDGIIWQRDEANNPVLPAGETGTWDRNNFLPKVLELNNTLYMWYTAESNPGVSGTAIGLATSLDTGKTWTKYSENPIITRGQSGSWDYGWIELGSVVLKDSLFYLWYDGQASSTSKGRIGLTTSQNVTPVELTSFTATANDKEVILSWSTATELNNQGFEVQRKFGSNEFVTIGSVKGHGTTTSPNNYTYTDKLTDAGKYFYRLKQTDFGGKYEYSQTLEINWSPFTTYMLDQNFPNPLNPTTTIGFGIPEKGNVRLSVLNILGEEIKILLNEEKEAGYHAIDFNASDLPSSVYFYRIQAVPSSSSRQAFSDTKKMILLK
jgi:hypothetical protein